MIRRMFMKTTYPFDRIRKARYMREARFVFEYLEVDGNHGSMLGVVWPKVFEFFDWCK